MATTTNNLRPIVICGPSGVGKGTLLNRLLSDYSNKFGFSVSHTTRKPRPGEQEGVNYYYTTREVMEQEIKEGKFIEHADVHGNLYGTSIRAVQDVSKKQGKCCILDIDVQGSKQVRNNKELNPVIIFIKPPSMEVLESRLRGRATETEESIQIRLKNARTEIEEFEKDDGTLFDGSVVNGEIETAYTDLKQTIERLVPAVAPLK
ncbi:hypothetical protein ABK040_009846 [Willaertia magna]